MIFYPKISSCGCYDCNQINSFLSRKEGVNSMNDNTQKVLTLFIKNASTPELEKLYAALDVELRERDIVERELNGQIEQDKL